MIITYSIILIAIVTILNIIRLSSSAQTTQKTKQALDAIKTLRSLTENVPKHRGMTNAFLQGDESFKPKMNDVQKQINKSIDNLELQSQDLNSQNILNSTLLISQKWHTLRNNVYSMRAPDSFETHSEIIQQIIYLMEEIAHDFSLFKTNDQEHNSLLYALTKSLPDITESLGKARGIGAGIAAKQHCDVANRVKLKYLHQHIKQVISLSLSGSQVFKQHFLTETNDALENTNEFLTSLNDELIETPSIDITPERYYSIATDAISSNFNLYDKIYPMIVENILALKQAENNRATFHKILNISILFLMPIIFYLVELHSW